MLISALCDYYDILRKKGLTLPEGYSSIGVSYLVELRPDGSISGIVDCQETISVPKGKGKTQEKSVPRNMVFPKRTEKPGIDANIAEHRPLYLFGLDFDQGVLTTLNPKGTGPNKAVKSHQAFVEKQLEFLEGLHSPLIDAYRNFVNSWEPENETNNPFLLSTGKSYGTARYAFCLEGKPDLLLQDDPVFLDAWEKHLAEANSSAKDAVYAQCCITGKNAPIAIIHDKIKGVPGGQTSGTLLVCYKGKAVESYGKTQSYNSCISVEAMRKYTEALNCLIKDKQRHTFLNSGIIIHWAMSDNDLYDRAVDAGAFGGYVDDSDKMDATETEKALSGIMAKMRNAIVTGEELKISEYLDPNVSFYMAGLKPNSSRLAVQFVYHNQFGAIMQNIAHHQADLQIGKQVKFVPLWRIEQELANPKSTDKEVDPALLSRLLESIFKGYRYPTSLLSTVIRRIKSDSDGDDGRAVKLTPLRAGIIKACLNRNSRVSGQKEEITMSLNTENENPAYLCGRLFAVMEKLQQDASGGNLNRTIKDAYFSSACSTPAVVFPRLIMLAQHHIGKATYGGFWNYTMGQIMEMLGNVFPTTLTLSEQGQFILGYYQQYWAKNKSKSDTQNSEEE